MKPDNIRKWKVLQSLQDRNETLFYRLLMDNFYDMAPIIYTPTVGWACSHFSHLYRRPRGMYFCKYDKGEMASMIYNWESDQVRVTLQLVKTTLPSFFRLMLLLSLTDPESLVLVILKLISSFFL